jgi:UDP-N-acetylmuramyl pentapeptide phosphotransferase/UDP-N-acetylglucosamine-1-phosphate transferase
MAGASWQIAWAVFFAALAVSAGLLALLLPWLRRYALVHPNARSSHKEVRPQGGGIGVTAATLTAALGGIGAQTVMSGPLALIFSATAVMAIVGAIDDVRNLGVAPRLVLQTLAAALILPALPAELRVLPFTPLWLERTLTVVGIVWFVNLTNFMDGIDWMTVAELVPVTAALALFGVAGELPREPALIATALCGAMLGFAPYNRPVARLFLGDVGSLPVGLLLAWLMIELAGHGHFSAAVLLPLYYVADATLTLLRRLATRQSIVKPHRGHFYQHALDAGFSVRQIVTRVFLLNLALIALATATLYTSAHLLHLAAIALGCMLVGGLLYRFEHVRR